MEPLDNYYAKDIHQAVNQAKERPHHYDYSNTYRYKRTTAQSIELNRLNLNELEDTLLTIDGKSVTISPKISENDVVALDVKEVIIPENQSITISIDAFLPISSEYQSQFGAHKSTNVINQGQVISTPKP